MVSVADSAVDGGSSPSTRCTTGLLTPPGHWCPAPAIVTSPTARPCGHDATEEVTGGASVTAGAGQPSTRRQAATTSATAGPSMWPGPSPGPPSYGMLWSAVPWMWMTDTGAGAEHG